MAQGTFHLNVGYLNGARKFLLIYTAGKTPQSQVMDASDSIDALAEHVGLHYYALTGPRSPRFTNAAAAPSAWRGDMPALRRGVGRQEFESFWNKVQEAYCRHARDGSMHYRAA